MRKTPIAWSAVLMLALSLGFPGPSTLASAQSERARSRDDARGEVTGRCVAVRVFAPEKRGERRRRQERFSATEILDLEIRVLFPESLDGEHRLDVKLYTPDHQLYQVLTVPFQADPATASSASSHRDRRRKLADYPRPLREEMSRPEHEGRRRYQAVSARLPVAGTSIVTGSLYGTWTAVAYLDESSESCVSPRTFSITE